MKFTWKDLWFISLGHGAWHVLERRRGGSANHAWGRATPSHHTFAPWMSEIKERKWWSMEVRGTTSVLSRSRRGLADPRWALPWLQLL